MDARQFDPLVRVISVSDSRRGLVAFLATLPVLGGLRGFLTPEEENAAIALRWHEDVINTQDLTVLDEVLAPDAPQDSATFADNPGPRQVLGALFAGFPDVQHSVEAVITDGDLVVVRYTATGTHEGAFQGYAPTGKAVTWTGVNIYRIECGRIAETWSEVDALGRIEQMSGDGTTALPAVAPAP